MTLPNYTKQKMKRGGVYPPGSYPGLLGLQGVSTALPGLHPSLCAL